MAYGGTKNEQGYNMIEQQRDTALLEKANKSTKMIWVTFRKEGNNYVLGSKVRGTLRKNLPHKHE